MRINSLNFYNLNKYENRIKQTRTTPISFYSQSDCFIKTTKSTSFSANKNNLSKGLTNTQKAVYWEMENLFATLLEAFTNTKAQNKLTKAKTFLSLDELIAILTDNNEIEVEIYKSVFDYGKITTVGQLQSATKMWKENKNLQKIFEEQELEYFYIFGLLQQKSDLVKFPETLLFWFNELTTEKDSNMNGLNFYTFFCRMLGINKEDEIPEKLSYLKDKFNNFESTVDKIEAISHLRETYENKITHIKNVFKLLGEEKMLPDELYAKNLDVIDAIFEEYTSGAFISILGLFPLLKESTKLNDKTGKGSQSLGLDLSNPKDKLTLFELLEECGISISDFNKISKRNIISDSDTMLNIINCQSICEYVSKIKNCSYDEAKKLYIKFFAILNSLYENNEEREDDLKTFFSLVSKEKINSHLDFLKIYNNVYKTKKESITNDETKEFVKIIKFSPSNFMFKKPMQGGKTGISILIDEKAKFEKLKPEIEKFIKNDTKNYFTGKSSFEIYKEYKNVFKNDPKLVNPELTKIVNLNAQTSKEYFEKLEEIGKFTQIFNDSVQAREFILKNQITFENTEDEKQYRDNCLKVLEYLMENESDETRLEMAKKLTVSNFISNSKPVLSAFLSQSSDKKQIKRILTTCINREVPSIQEFQTFCKKYKATDIEAANKIITYINSLPSSLRYEFIKDSLGRIEKKIKSTNIPISIDVKNIDKILKEELTNHRRESYPVTTEFVNRLMNIPTESNFILHLPDAYLQNEKMISAFKISNELAQNYKKTDESYQNIFNLFNISKEDLDLKADSSITIFAKKIEKNLPQEFVDFINDNSWLKNKTGQIYNISLHAKLRIIDRFILNEKTSINELYTEETKSKLADFIENLYSKPPEKINAGSNRIVINSQWNDKIIESVFTETGLLITSVEKK